MWHSPWTLHPSLFWQINNSFLKSHENSSPLWSRKPLPYPASLCPLGPPFLVRWLQYLTHCICGASLSSAVPLTRSLIALLYSWEIGQWHSSTRKGREEGRGRWVKCCTFPARLYYPDSVPLLGHTPKCRCFCFLDKCFFRVCFREWSGAVLLLEGFFCGFQQSTGLLLPPLWQPFQSSSFFRDSQSPLRCMWCSLKSYERGRTKGKAKRDQHMYIFLYSTHGKAFFSFLSPGQRNGRHLSSLFRRGRLVFFSPMIIPCACSGIEIDGKSGHVINNINFVYTFLFVPKTVGKSSCDRF